MSFMSPFLKHWLPSQGEANAPAKIHRDRQPVTSQGPPIRQTAQKWVKGQAGALNYRPSFLLNLSLTATASSKLFAAFAEELASENACQLVFASASVSLSSL